MFLIDVLVGQNMYIGSYYNTIQVFIGLCIIVYEPLGIPCPTNNYGTYMYIIFGGVFTSFPYFETILNKAIIISIMLVRYEICASWLYVHRPSHTQRVLI